MLTICFDGAGKDSTQHRLIVIGGLASFAGIWKEFEIKWQERLDRDGLSHFHAGDYSHSVGAFKQWKGDERRRRALASDLFSIIEDCGLRKFGCIMRLDDFRSVLQKHSNSDSAWPSVDAFGMAAMRAAESFFAYATNEGVKNNVRCVWEKGDPEDVLRKLFREQGYADPLFTWGKTHIDSKGFTHDPFLGLQAAGWVAYEYYLDADRLLYSNPTNRWALERFQSLPGEFTLLANGPLLPNAESMTEDFERQLRHVREATKRLESSRVYPADQE